ncbi:hypothetical protein PI172_0581 [Prevotella intermedia]|uniref:Uncharacterized protein n=1 Tax=Prevotella intermedia TaxID=28131 RepID=A0AAD1BGN2_PREIN|nr:hypothetical protein PI172_0581 [Prevotella intermedia]
MTGSFCCAKTIVLLSSAAAKNAIILISNDIHSMPRLY